MDHIGGAVREDGSRPVGVGEAGVRQVREGTRRGVRVEEEPGYGCAGEHGAGRVVGDQEGGGRVAEQEGDARGRVGGIDGEVGGARLEDGEHGGDQVGGARQRQGHHALRARSPGGQQPGQAVGAGVQFRVGEPDVR